MGFGEGASGFAATDGFGLAAEAGALAGLAAGDFDAAGDGACANATPAVRIMLNKDDKRIILILSSAAALSRRSRSPRISPPVSLADLEWDI